MDYQVFLLNQNNTFEKQDFSSKDLANVFLLDFLRGQNSFGNKAFAVVLHEQNYNFVYIQNNETVWKNPSEFFCENINGI